MKTDLETPIFVESVEDLEGLKKYQKIKFFCKECHREYERLYMKSRLPQISQFLCWRCLRRKTCMEKYGCENVAQNKKVMKKIQKNE